MLTFVGLGALFVILAVPLITGRVPPNGFFGLRVPATFQNREVWYQANARSGWDLLWLGVFLIALALVLPLFGLRDGAFEAVWGAAAVVGAITVAAVNWRRANRLLEERR